MKPVADILSRFVNGDDEARLLADIASARADRLNTETGTAIAVMLSSGGLFLLVHFSQLTSAKLFNLEFSDFNIPYLLLLGVANLKIAEFLELRAKKGLNDLVLHWCRSRQFQGMARNGYLPLIFNSIHDVFPKFSQSTGLLVRARYSVPALKNLPFALGFLLFPLWSCYAVWSSQRFPWWVCSMVSLGLLYLAVLSLLNMSYFATLWDEDFHYKTTY